MPTSKKYKDMRTVIVGKVESGSKGDNLILILMPNKVKSQSKWPRSTVSTQRWRKKRYVLCVASRQPEDQDQDQRPRMKIQNRRTEICVREQSIKHNHCEVKSNIFFSSFKFLRPILSRLLGPEAEVWKRERLFVSLTYHIIYHIISQSKEPAGTASARVRASRPKIT